MNVKNKFDVTGEKIWQGRRGPWWGEEISEVLFLISVPTEREAGQTQTTPALPSQQFDDQTGTLTDSS